MNLTEEQGAVVEIDAGRHLVLAPPGSGKTEMLSQRILRALRQGVPSNRMLCATFTNRAAFEMRERVHAEAEGEALPDVGNLHHHCERFLRAAGVIPRVKRIIDEAEQRDLIREVANVLRAELRAGKPSNLKETHGITVLAHVKGLTAERVRILHEELETYIAGCEKNGIDYLLCALAGVTVVHQRRIGIPRNLSLPWPSEANALSAMGILDPLEKAYRGLKRRFLALDFEDLLNETYLHLLRNPLENADRFSWVQIDEVQDLNPLQWAIVRELTAIDAVSLYFGDLEQSIFSFLGASLEHLQEATVDCSRHFFRMNFRSTPLLLEVLMRYSLGMLESDRDFISVPNDLSRGNGEIRLEEGACVDDILKSVDGLLRTNRAETVAILVKTNLMADLFEKPVKSLGWRFVKVSGFELASYRPMRDFAAFVDLFAGNMSRSTWTMLSRRFGEGLHTSIEARYFVREMFAAGWDPMLLFAENDVIPRLPPVGRRSALWAWRNRRTLVSLRRKLKPVFDEVHRSMADNMTFRKMFGAFEAMVFDEVQRYSVRELLPGEKARTWRDAPVTYEQAREHVRERIEKFLRYTDSVYAGEERTFSEVLEEDWNQLKRLKEADLLVGDERIVISTVHKAKGRQFDAVVIPGIENFNRDDEARRLLYVAMSRAKRHLLLFCGRKAGAVPWIAECFGPGYVGYYLRKAQEADLRDDWMFKWERLADLNRAGCCDMEAVGAALTSSCAPVARMALKTLRHHQDKVEQRMILLACLRCELGYTAPRESVVHALQEIECFDDETAGAVRDVCLALAESRIWWAAFHYYRVGLKFAPKPAQVFRLCLGDCIYAQDGEVRRRAAEKLDEINGTELRRIVFGTSKDYERLALIPDKDHEETIRAILRGQALSADYAEGLRLILLARAAGL